MKRGRGLTTALAAATCAALLALGSAVLLATPPPLEKSAHARSMERKLAERPPAILVIGNSMAEFSLDEATLQRRLRRPVTTLWVAHSHAPVWYLVLKNRVFGAGHAPGLVIVPTFLQSALGLGFERALAQDHERLEAQMGPHEPVIEAKVFGGGGAGWLRSARRNTRRLRRTAVWGPTWLTLGISPLDSVDLVGWLRRGRRRAEGAMERVFELTELIAARQEAAQDARYQQILREVLPPVEAGLVGDLVDLVHDQGAHVVFVRVPPAPGNVDADVVSIEQELALVRFLNDKGAGYLDFRSLPLGPDDYRDSVHMDDSGMRLVSEALLEKLAAWGGLDHLVIPDAPLPTPPPRIARIGQAPPVLPVEPTPSGGDRCPLEVQAPIIGLFDDAALGPLGLLGAIPLELREGRTVLKPRGPDSERCGPGELMVRGDRVRFQPRSRWPWTRYAIGFPEAPSVRGTLGQVVHWVLPGTALHFSFEEGWARSGPFVLEVSVQPIGGDGGRPDVRLGGGRSAPLEGRGGRLGARLESREAPQGPWSFAIHSPEDGPYLAVQGLSLGHPDRPRPLLALQHNSWGPSVELLATLPPETAGLFVPDRAPDHPALSGRKPRAGPRGTGQFDLPGLDHLAGPCSPVMVREDGELLRNANDLVRRVAKCAWVPGNPGSSCHEDAILRFSTTDGSAPTHNGRRYSLSLVRTPGAGALCVGARWLFPGDTLTLRSSGQERALQQGANLLSLAGSAHGRPARGELEVAIEADGAVRQRRTLPVAALDDDVATIPIDRVPPSVQGLAVRVSNSGPAAVLLRKVTLIEARPARLDALNERRAAWADREGRAE